jgi:hypothetical protein
MRAALLALTHTFTSALQALKVWMRTAVIAHRDNQNRCTLAAIQLRRARDSLACAFDKWRFERSGWS